MRRYLLLAVALPAFAGLPGWWKALPSRPALASEFTQESDSAVFGVLKQRGSLLLARGGKLRVTYQSGLLVVSDGKRLVQYDPDTRTAQGVDLQEALKDYPLLSLLTEPGRLERLYRAEPLAHGAVRLHPRIPGLPEVTAEGHDDLLASLAWTDATGARQRLVLEHPRVPPPPAESTFRFEAPTGTRWVTASR